jgi:cyanophycin synthetase
VNFKSEFKRQHAGDRRTVPMRIRLDDAGQFDWARNMQVIRDARGVRLARELED